MTYTDIEIAAVAWAADAEFRALHGDPDPSLPGHNGDAGAHEVTLAGVRAILEGATPEDLHEAWRRDREAKGWACGPRPDSRAKTHPALVPYGELPGHRRVQGAVLAAVVRAMGGLDGTHPVPVSPGLCCARCGADPQDGEFLADAASLDTDFREDA